MERELDSLSRSVHTTFVDGPILIDAMWDNPNYWLRFSMIRAALGSAHVQEIGLTGKYAASNTARTLRNFGINRIVSWASFKPASKPPRDQANRLLANTTSAQDILSWKLPYDFPQTTLYDGILKRQRGAYVDITHPRFLEDVTEALEEIETAFRLVESIKPKLVLLSHAINFDYGALAWAAIKNGIPAILLFGQFGVARFAKINSPKDLENCMDAPTRKHLDALTPQQQDRLVSRGKAILAQRLAGETNDLGAVYAFKRRQTIVTRDMLRNTFGWDDSKPVIGIYAANWFDYPHFLGMTNFRDFLDWIELTVDVATQNTKVNWLFKAHPCDEWYGGITINDLISDKSAPHIRIAPTDWQGHALLESLDGLVTIHSTSAMEAAALGKAALVADRGWYHDCGFVKWARTREDYTDALSGEWWRDIDLESSSYQANLFAGCYLGLPSWQTHFILQDDSHQAEIYAKLPRLLSHAKHEIQHEINMLRSWLSSEQKHFHTFKVLENLNCDVN